MREKVVVGMSGGVDSSVAAYLLKEQGYDVTGVTMQTWQEAEGSVSPETGAAGEADCSGVLSETGAAGEADCSGVLPAAADARRVAEVLGIPHYVMDFRREFRGCVMDYFVEEYLQGRTPNPCIACNRYVKWEALLRRSRELGADYIATGHYARIERLPGGRFSLRSCLDAGKDQTYALYNLTQEQLAHTLMPLGSYSKAEIRRLAEEAGLPVAHKPDSQEICFVPDDDYAGFIDQTAGDRVPGPGKFVDSRGNVLGTHRGITHYTIGQRRGLGLPMGERVFVTRLRPETNEVVIGSNEDLLSRRVICDRVNYMAVEGLESPARVLARIRYNHRGEYGRIETISGGRILCTFEKPVRAAAPGQAIVFYDDGYVLGGGTILGAEA